MFMKPCARSVLLQAMGDLPLHRPHLGTPRSDVSPASSKRFKLSSAFGGHPALALARCGFSEK